MNNCKNKFVVFFVVVLSFALTLVYPGISAYAQEAKDKEVRDATGPKTVVKQDKEIKNQKNPYADVEITVKIIPSANNTYGYDILVHNRPLIHQPHIPGLPGNEGFATKDKAQKVAQFVVKKIRNNEMPPTVTMEDLKKWTR